MPEPMTPPDPADDELRALVERLLRKVHRGKYQHGGGAITTDGSGKTTGTTWGGEKILELANPDGPAAVAAIEALLARTRPAIGEDEIQRLIPVCRRARETAIRLQPGSNDQYQMKIDEAIVTDILAAIRGVK